MFIRICCYLSCSLPGGQEPALKAEPRRLSTQSKAHGLNECGKNSRGVSSQSDMRVSNGTELAACDEDRVVILSCVRRDGGTVGGLPTDQLVRGYLMIDSCCVQLRDAGLVFRKCRIVRCSPVRGGESTLGEHWSTECESWLWDDG